MKHLWLLFLCLLPCTLVAQERLRIVEWNVENLFDTEHGSKKNDLEFTPNSPRHWTRTKYWEKLNKVGQGIISCGEDSARTYLPDLIGIVRSGKRQHDDLPYTTFATAKSTLPIYYDSFER